MLFDLANEIGIHPKRCASTNGGEYHSACPACGGKDRFVLWPAKNRYWCRQCDCSGDSIQFCRDFLGMDFRSACLKLNIEPQEKLKTLIRPVLYDLKIAIEPPCLWQQKASVFVNWADEQLALNEHGMQQLYRRGFTDSSIQKFRLGYCKNPRNMLSKDIYCARGDWGLPKELKPDGKEKKLRLPHGLIIPTFQDDKVIKLKIRLQEWKPGDPQKYSVISGSKIIPMVIGNLQAQPAILVESEFDAMLIHQEAGDLCACVALGGIGKPDLETHGLLNRCSLILFALDYDSAGKGAYSFWRNTYSQLRPWPIPATKSPGDAFQAGINLRQWVLDGFKHYNM